MTGVNASASMGVTAIPSFFAATACSKTFFWSLFEGCAPGGRTRLASHPGSVGTASFIPFSMADQKGLLLLVMISMEMGPFGLRGLSNLAAAELAAPAGAVVAAGAVEGPVELFVELPPLSLQAGRQRESAAARAALASLRRHESGCIGRDPPVWRGRASARARGKWLVTTLKFGRFRGDSFRTDCQLAA